MLNADEGSSPVFEVISRGWPAYAPAAKVPEPRSALIVRFAHAHSTSKPSETWTQESKTEAARYLGRRWNEAVQSGGEYRRSGWQRDHVVTYLQGTSRGL
jgi:hypothetical protein